jgi:hypothetical protein
MNACGAKPERLSAILYVGIRYEITSPFGLFFSRQASLAEPPARLTKKFCAKVIKFIS